MEVMIAILQKKYITNGSLSGTLDYYIYSINVNQSPNYRPSLSLHYLSSLHQSIAANDYVNISNHDYFKILDFIVLAFKYNARELGDIVTTSAPILKQRFQRGKNWKKAINTFMTCLPLIFLNYPESSCCHIMVKWWYCLIVEVVADFKDDRFIDTFHKSIYEKLTKLSAATSLHDEIIANDHGKMVIKYLILMYNIYPASDDNHLKMLTLLRVLGSVKNYQMMQERLRS